MNQKSAPPFYYRLELITILLAIASPGSAAMITWTNTLGGNWSVAANWNPNQVPGTADSAQITTSGNYTVTNDQNASVSTFCVGNGANGVQNLQVANGATLTFTGNSTVNGALSVANGGSLQAGGSLYLNGPLTNAGTLNLTNGCLYLYNNGSTYQGGLVNRVGAQINLGGAGGISSQLGSDNYFVNQGTVTKAAGTGTSQISASVGVLEGAYNAASGTVIQFGGGTSSAPLQPDASLALNGPGQYQFSSGYLNYPTDAIPGLLPIGGLLSLGPGFQGGSITNLVLVGGALTNTLPVTGTLIMTNSTAFGALTVSNRAVLSVYDATFAAQVTVQNGGQLLVSGPSTEVGDGSGTNGWLTVQSGGLVQVAGYVSLSGPVTNAGTFNLASGYVVNAYNDGSAACAGGILNQPGGVIDLWNNSALHGTSRGDEYLINRGTISLMAGTGAGSINFYNLDLGAGTITTQPGAEILQVGMFDGMETLAGTYDAGTNSTIQFSANASPGTSAGSPLVLGGSGQYQFVEGLLTLPAAVIPNLALTGGNLALGAGFQGGAITNLVLNWVTLTNTLPVTGTLIMTNGTAYGVITVSNGGALSVSSSVLAAQVTVQAGGQLLATGNSSISNPGSQTNNWLWVQNGGLLLAAGNFFFYGPLTNAGTVNVTNGCYLDAVNDGTTRYTGGIVNVGTGVIDLWNNGSLYGNNFGGEYLINQGTINLMTGPGTSYLNFYHLDLGAGTISTQAGTWALQVGAFNGLGNLAGMYNAAANSMIQFTADASPGTSEGTPLVLGGAGGYQFIHGLLTLPTTEIPNLVMNGGTLSLGPDFEGGAITNLVLDGVTLSNTLPISGTLTVTNSTLYTCSSISNGASVSLNGVTLYGSLAISAAGVVSVYNSALDAQVTVQNGGQLIVNGSSASSVGDRSATNSWLTVLNGGLAQVAGCLSLFGPLTNSGTITVTNGGYLSACNNGTPANAGGIVNSGAGVINLWDDGSLYGRSSGNEYLINQGTITLMTGNAATINFYDLDLGAGTITTQPGTGTLQLGTFNGLGNLAGTYDAATNSIIQFTASANPGTSTGTPLLLGGTGQYQFVQGALTLTTAVIPNLAISGGTLSLGPNFEGGTITNLALNGVTLTNTLPISGTLAVTNSKLYTCGAISNGASISLNGVSVYGPLVISSGAVLTACSSLLDAQVTVQSGGQLFVYGNTSLGDGSMPNSWLMVLNGGLLQVAGYLSLYGPLTNAGTVNITNGYVVSAFNNATTGYLGGIANLGTGVLDLWDDGALFGKNYGHEYLLNQGAINLMTGTVATSLNFYDLDLGAGTITTEPGTGILQVETFNGPGTLTGTYDAATNSIIEFLAGTSPGTSPGGTLVLVGAGRYQFVQGMLTLTTTGIPNLEMSGGTLSLAPDFQGGAITNLVLSGVTLTNALPISGMLAMTNSTLYTSSTLSNGAEIILNGATVYGSLMISNAAALRLDGSTLDAQVTVQNGGQLLVVGNSRLGDGSATNIWLTVQNGGSLQAASHLLLLGPLTNSGTINVTNGCYLDARNDGTAANAGGIVNWGTGLIDLWNNGWLSGQYFGDEYLINRGTINLATGTGTSYLDFYNLDLAAGTITTQPGTWTLEVGTFNGPGSLAGTYNAAANSVIEFMAGKSPGTSPGSPLVLGGSGQYQFVQGLLTLPTAAIPNLLLSGGTLSLGPGFQGGAITNLVLDGITLTNTLPISGLLLMTNGTLYTSGAIIDGAEINLSGATVCGKLAVPGGTVLSVGNAVLDAQVTVQDGGELLIDGSTASLGDGWTTNSWLTVLNGGVLQAAGYLLLYGPLTNAGTINVPDGYHLDARNDGTAASAGGIVNLGTGVIDLGNGCALNGHELGAEYLVNQGTINAMSGTGQSSLNFSHLSNQAILSVQEGMLQLQSANMDLEPSGTLAVALNSPTDYGQFSVVGSAPLNGIVEVRLNNGFIPSAGSSFAVLSYGSCSGGFTGFGLPTLPSNTVWQPVYCGTALMLLLRPPIDLLSSANCVVINANGIPGHQALLLTTTNLNVPLPNWTPLATNTFDVTTYAGFTNNVNPGNRTQFFLIKPLLN